MKDIEGIIEQLGKLGSQRKKARKLTWGLSFLTLLLGIMSLFMSFLGITLFPELGRNMFFSPQPPIQSVPNLSIESFSDLIEDLENEPKTKRFEMLEKNLDSIPSNLSLNQLKGYIDLFLYESCKLNVIRLLQPKVTDNYSDGELKGFKKLFSSDGQSEVENLLSKK